MELLIAEIGSIIIEATSLPLFLLYVIILLTLFRHLSSSFLFACSCSAKGYLRLGKSAIGQSYVGVFYGFAVASLQERVPIELPW